MGTSDRIIRAVVGTGLLVVAALSHGIVRWVGLAGVVFIVTAIIRFCPAYWLMRIRTIRSASSSAESRT